ncbi:gamma-aminobutyric acid receptor subunit rho-2-like isoform X1 [Gigantopelta aegis]|uniref:gamma-aminobutyric acid receptor subunit rho-2-like isoform X1 n=1 Tax=Gigantopelta aegis TaxID=1735272 RepID=UPI001B88B4AA|nr:gamma-aminobutyric acid receptor subunit rho-2-like isoform X1 [Gigantopelta aegis]
MEDDEVRKTCVFRCRHNVSAESTEEKARVPTHGEKGDTRRTVWLRIVFLKIEEIDTVKEQFRSDLFLQAKWREPRLDGVCLKTVNVEEYWNPHLHIENGKNSPTQSVRASLEFDHCHNAFIVEKRRIHGDFAENLELEEFPFDVQSLSVLVSSEHPESQVELVEDPNEASSLNKDSFAQAQVWTLMDFVEVERKSIDNKFSLDSYKRAGIFFRCCAYRRSGFFLWNNFLFMALITAMSFTIFAVDRNDPGRRLQLTFILILTGMTFKYVVTKSLPKISYLTHLDKYIICSMVFLFVVCIWHGIVPLLGDDVSLSQQFDLWLLLIFVFIFVLTQITFLVMIIGRGHKKRKNGREKLAAYRNKLNAIKFQKDKKKRLGAVMKRKQSIVPY